MLLTNETKWCALYTSYVPPVFQTDNRCVGVDETLSHCSCASVQYLSFG